jgi:hypothetical protein
VSACGCPSRDGQIYHDRATCTDPVVRQFNWYADYTDDDPAVFEVVHAVWPCEAYGTKGLEIGALCFIAPDPGSRECQSAEICREIMKTERQRVFDRIQQGARNGIAEYVFMAQRFTSPDQLRGGNID